MIASSGGVRRAAYGGFMVLVMIAAACSSPKQPTPVQNPELWGDLKPVVSVKELMRDLIDPLADNIFNAVGVVEDAHGVVETAPKTDEDWDRLRIGATAMAETAYLLKVRRPFAPPGDLNNSTGP